MNNVKIGGVYTIENRILIPIDEASYVFLLNITDPTISIQLVSQEIKYYIRKGNYFISCPILDNIKFDGYLGQLDSKDFELVLENTV